jgi:antitoxin CptB
MPMPDMLAKRLRWRCRRGMRELDQLLESRLAILLMQRDDDALTGFERLLDCEDDQLWRWCLDHETPPDPQIAAEVDAVRAHRPA